MGGENKVREQIERCVLAVWQGSLRVTPRRLLATLAASVVAVTAISAVPATDAQAERLIQISGARRTVSVTIAVGKTEDVHVDAPFSDITVGDPEVADVAPLTDQTLSILAKKIGTTRVTVYAEGKRQLGIFDIEVSYDVSRLATEIRSAVGPGIRVSSVNGRIMLSGSAPDAATLDKAVVIARQFAPEIINTVRVASPQQVMLEVRFVEASRQASRELGVQWNVYNSHLTSNIGSRRTPGLLPITAPASATNIPAGEVAAGLLSGASPFGFMLGRILAGGTTIDVMINALEQRGLARSLAEPNLTALSGDTASFLAGGEFPIPVSGTNNAITVEFKRYGISSISTMRSRSGPACRQFRRSSCAGQARPSSCATARASSSEVCCRVSTRAISSRCPGWATCPCSARCSRAAPFKGTKPTSPSSSRPAWCARRGPATRSKRRSTIRCQGTMPTSSWPARPRFRARSCAPPWALSCRIPDMCSIFLRESKMSSSRTRTCAAIVAVGAALGGCSDIYFDRRETVSLGANDAVETNKVVHMVDPWPRSSANRQLAFEGERMQAAHERYRHNRVVTPVNVTTSSAAYQKAQAEAAAAASATAAAATPAAPVKGP